MDPERRKRQHHLAVRHQRMHHYRHLASGEMHEWQNHFSELRLGSRHSELDWCHVSMRYPLPRAQRYVTQLYGPPPP